MILVIKIISIQLFAFFIYYYNTHSAILMLLAGLAGIVLASLLHSALMPLLPHTHNKIAWTLDGPWSRNSGLISFWADNLHGKAMTIHLGIRSGIKEFGYKHPPWKEHSFACWPLFLICWSDDRYIRDDNV